MENKQKLYIDGELNSNYCKGHYVVNRVLPETKCSLGVITGVYFGNSGNVRYKVKRVNDTITDWCIENCTIAPEGFVPSEELLAANKDLK